MQEKTKLVPLILSVVAGMFVTFLIVVSAVVVGIILNHL
jgi:hypothetical protein